MSNAEVERVLFVLVFWFVYYDFRQNLKLDAFGIWMRLCLFIGDIFLYYPIVVTKGIIKIFSHSNQKISFLRTVTMLTSIIWRISRSLLFFPFRFPGRLRRLRLRRQIDRQDTFACPICFDMQNSLEQRDCQSCGMTSVVNRVEPCRQCGHPANNFFQCQNCGNSIRIR